MYSLDTGNLSTLAGTGERGHKDGKIKHAIFDHPTGIAVDKNGDLYITQSGCVRKIDVSEGTVSTIAGKFSVAKYVSNDDDSPKLNTRMLYHPQGIAVSENGNVYVADSHYNCIRKIKDGLVSTVIGTSNPKVLPNGFNYPYGISVLDDETFVISDKMGIKILNSDGKFNLIPVSPNISLDGQFCERNGTLFVGLSSKKMLFKLERVWKKYERYVWIGYLKEEASYCPLATLPRDIIKQIASYLSSTEVFPESFICNSQFGW